METLDGSLFYCYNCCTKIKIMDTLIKIVVLEHCNLISGIEEVQTVEIGDPNCKLINPYLFNSIDDMKPWKSEITNQTEFMIRSENILTILDPNGTILDKYTELTA